MCTNCSVYSIHGVCITAGEGGSGWRYRWRGMSSCLCNGQLQVCGVTSISDILRAQHPNTLRAYFLHLNQVFVGQHNSRSRPAYVRMQPLSGPTQWRLSLTTPCCMHTGPPQVLHVWFLAFLPAPPPILLAGSLYMIDKFHHLFLCAGLAAFFLNNVLICCTIHQL